jgi:hypothetical protein
LHRVLTARGDMSDEGARRLARVEALFAAPPANPAQVETIDVRR